MYIVHAYRISYRMSYNYILFKTQRCKYRQISQGRCFYQVVDFNPTTFFSELFCCNATPHCITSAQVPCCSFWWRDGHCAKSCTGREEHRWKSMENLYKIDGRLFVEYAVPELGRLQRKQLKKVWYRCRCDSKTGPDSAGSALAKLEFSDQSQDSIAARASAHQHTQEELLSVQFKHSIGIEMQAQASKVPASNKAQSDGGLSLVQHGLCREVAKAQQPNTLGRCIKPLLLRDFQCWALSRADQCRSAHIPATAAIPSMSRQLHEFSCLKESLKVPALLASLDVRTSDKYPSGVRQRTVCKDQLDQHEQPSAPRSKEPLAAKFGYAPFSSAAQA